MIKTLADYVSKEASVADWLSGVGTFAAVLIALSPQIGRVFFGLFPPRVSVSIAGRGNIVISSDGKIHKIQIPYQIENEGIANIFIEEMQISVLIGEELYDLPWRKFISDVQGSATAPISNPYRFRVEPKNTSERFIEFLTEDNLQLSKGICWIETKVIFTFSSRTKKLSLKKKLNIDDVLLAQIKLNSQHAKKDAKPLLVGISIQG